MIDMRKSLRRLVVPERDWKKMMKSLAREAPSPVDETTHLTETRDFGSNPGALRMFSHLPQEMTGGCPLVVVLHGCTQSAASYDLGAGWSTLADRFGFALLFPEQQRSNNPNGCFNWFLPGDIERGRGEAASIRQMVARMVSEHGIDPRRVFVTGLSAGGAMTSVMLATYPDVFAGGAIIAGLPYRAATNVQQAFENMYKCPPRSARAWGELVRQASSHQGPWPRVSVWHGGADKTVIPSNAIEIVKQWTDVHGLPADPSFEAVIDGYPRQVWTDGAGEELIESYTIPTMAHGTPLATGLADHECGMAGPFLLNVGISSSYHIAKFWGLARMLQPPGRTLREDVQQHRGFVRADPAAPAPEAPEANLQSHSKHPHIDVGAVITKALRAAGLMKEG